MQKSVQCINRASVRKPPPPKHAALRDSANNLDYVVITWPSTGTPGGVMIVAKSLRSMVPATRFELVTP
jgi:hypothetical protein